MYPFPCIISHTSLQDNTMPFLCEASLMSCLQLLREEMARGPGSAFRMPNVDSMRALSVLNTFFNNHPASPPADDTPYCSAKTFLAQMLEALGVQELLRICSILKIPEASFLIRLVYRMTGGAASGNNTTTASGSSMFSSAPSGEDLKEKIVSIIDRITSVSKPDHP
jgi:hypothetical protein